MDSTVEKLAEGVDELKGEVEGTIVEFTDSLKEKLLSPQAREAIDTIKYLIGNMKPNFYKKDITHPIPVADNSASETRMS